MASKGMNGSDGRRFLRQAEQAFGDMDSQLTAKDAEILNLKRDIKRLEAQNKVLQPLIVSAKAWYKDTHEKVDAMSHTLDEVDIDLFLAIQFSLKEIGE